MKTIALEDIMGDTILSFLENVEELGCPHDEYIDMWFRNRTNEEREDIMDKLLEIQERQLQEEEEDGKEIMMREITLDLDEETIKELLSVARSLIVNDEQALINYGANHVLKEMIERKN